MATDAWTEADTALVAVATEAREHALAELSGYRVGAALLAADGSIHGGCNLENIILGASPCAEMVAVWKALSEGQREFVAVAVVAEGDPPPAPCGRCRQLLQQWGVERVLVANPEGDREVLSMSALLPRPFHLTRPTGQESA